MAPLDWLELFLGLVLLLTLSVPLGLFIAKVLEGERTFLTQVLGWMERLTYRVGGINPEEAMSWKHYATCVVGFSFIGAVALYLIQRFQGVLPLNPTGMDAVRPDIAFNTASSFVTNTNWQVYGGETTMSHLTQMMGLTVQNFLSAATGLAVLAALVRGLRVRQTASLGNFWADLTRVTVYVLLPLSLVFSLVLVSQGVVQTLSGPTTVTPLQAGGEAPALQSIAVGPVASQVAIKQLGTNGGGFFNANSGHPFENPTPLSNFLCLLAILLIPAALCHTFGQMVRDRRQGWALLAAMSALFLLAVTPTIAAELDGNPGFTELGLASTQNWEGKEARIGVVNSAAWATATTATGSGSVNASKVSFTPLGSLFPMAVMQTGGVVFGGVGSGVYGMIVLVLLAVFLSGQIVGRIPVYLGKRVGLHEVKLAVIVVIIPSALVLVVTAIGLVGPPPVAGAGPDAHGFQSPRAFSELLFAHSSLVFNNGVSVGIVLTDSALHNFGGGVLMWVSRFSIIVLVLALAGSMARKTPALPGASTLPTHTPLFIALLICVVLAMGVLTFVPALMLGPVAEHLKLIR